MAELKWDQKFIDECFKSLETIYYSLEGNVGSTSTSRESILFSESKGSAVSGIESFYSTMEELKAQMIEIVSSTQAYLSEATGIMISEDQSIAGKLKS